MTQRSNGKTISIYVSQRLLESLDRRAHEVAHRDTGIPRSRSEIIRDLLEQSLTNV